MVKKPKGPMIYSVDKGADALPRSREARDLYRLSEAFANIKPPVKFPDAPHVPEKPKPIMQQMWVPPAIIIFGLAMIGWLFFIFLAGLLASIGR